MVKFLQINKPIIEPGVHKAGPVFCFLECYVILLFFNRLKLIAKINVILVRKINIFFFVAPFTFFRLSCSVLTFCVLWKGYNLQISSYIPWSCTTSTLHFPRLENGGSSSWSKYKSHFQKRSKRQFMPNNCENQT